MKIEHFLKKLLHEILRVLPLVFIIIPFLFLDESWQLVLFVTALISFILLTTHIVRKTMYPYIDIEELILKSKESSLASSIVFFGFVFLLSIIILSYTLLLIR